MQINFGFNKDISFSMKLDAESRIPKQNANYEDRRAGENSSP